MARASRIPEQIMNNFESIVKFFRREAPTAHYG